MRASGHAAAMGPFSPEQSDDAPDRNWSGFPHPVGEIVPGISPNARPRERDAAIRQLAEGQSDVVGISQLGELGLSAGAVQARVRRGLLWPLFCGVYAVGRARVSRRGRWVGAILASGRGSALSHWSGASLLDLAGEPDRDVHVSTFGRSRRGQRGIRTHRPRALTRQDLGVVDGLPGTSVSRVLLDLAESATPRRLGQILDRAQQLGLYDQRAVDALLLRAGGHRGLGRLRRALPTTEPPVTRSQLERDFVELCRDRSLPQPSTNVVVAGHEVDAFFPAWALAVELDGFRYHRTRAAQEADCERAMALKLAGVELLRLTYAMVHGRPGEVAAAIRSAATTRGRD